MRRLFVGINASDINDTSGGAEGGGSEGKRPSLRLVGGEGEDVVAPWFLRSEY